MKSKEPKNTEPAFWGIHGGRTGDADSLFLKKNCIGLGWKDMGDLSKLGASRDSFKQHYAKVYPDIKGQAIATSAGMPYRFVHEMKVGDFVAYPSKLDKQIHIGRIDGEYSHAAGEIYPKQKKGNLAETYTTPALYSRCIARNWLGTRTFPDQEFRGRIQNVLQAKSDFATPISEDTTVAMVAEEIDDNTRDFVLKTLSQDLKGLPLEGFVVHLLQCMGYHARLTRRNEPSVDVIAHKDQLGIEPPIIKVQVKSSAGTATDKDVSALYGKISSGEFGLFITLGTFSPASRTFEQGKSNLRLIDGDELVSLIFEHYEQFDSQHKGMLPLRRVYVPLSIT